jgi:purine-nucleoside/S-methyl-5'-thioadenosine phosphorylase / adenosine deaminase
MNARVEILRSRLLADFPHGFTTRNGGVSRPPFDTANLGGAVGDAPGAVEANWEALRRETGLGFARVRQVHGDRVVVARGATEPHEEADAVVSALPGVAACVSVADCVPVLLADPRSGAVAALHAGWRGTIVRIAARGVDALVREVGASPTELVAAVGPGIGPCCFEVDRELAARFRGTLGPLVADARERGSRVDLFLANALVLREAGLLPARIEVLGRCTACDPRSFFSHRRDGGRSGRQVGFIAPGRPGPSLT